MRATMYDQWEYVGIGLCRVLGRQVHFMSESIRPYTTKITYRLKFVAVRRRCRCLWSTRHFRVFFHNQSLKPVNNTPRSPGNALRFCGFHKYGLCSIRPHHYIYVDQIAGSADCWCKPCKVSAERDLGVCSDISDFQSLLWICDSTSVRLRFDYDKSDRNYDSIAIRLQIRLRQWKWV